MPEPTAPPDVPEITFERIRERAYEIWDRNHRPEGLEVWFWLAAERELTAERRRASAAQAERPAGREDGPVGGD